MSIAQFPKEQSTSGEFERQEDAFREWVSNDGSTKYPALPNRYHLYVSLACPWASRTIIARKLFGLEHSISMTIVDPVRDERGWAFRDPDASTSLNQPFKSTDPVNRFHFLRQAYEATDPNFDGRVTVPVLWDKESGRIVNNCEDDICRMFNDVFRPCATNKDLNWFPSHLEPEHSKLADFVYENVNNGVYKAGFATRQRPYQISCRKLFAALDQLDDRLMSSRYLFGRHIVEVDWRLFCTLVRFDIVYYIHFKCSLRRILDYKNLQGYLTDLYQQPGIAETVNFDQIKRHYYITHDQINPKRIVPIGPVLDLNQPHGREHLG
jgi:putative glutathione S-transferase